MIFRAPANAEGHTALVTIAVMLGTLLQVLDTTIVNVALPNMQGSLSASQDQISWVLTSYIVGAAIMTPPTGWLAGRFGRKRIYIISMLGFLCASFLCGTATSLVEIVLLRVVQGLFGAAMVPISQAILLDSYPREKHGMAMAIFGMGIMLGPILGPVLGAYLTEYYTWRWVFFINIPVGILAILMTLAYVRETVINRERTFDGWGFVFLSVAIGALQMVLDRGERKDWFNSAEVLIEFSLVVIGLWLFFVHSFKRKNTYIDLSLFKDRNFAIGNVIGFVVLISLYSIMALIPQFVQNLLEFPVVITGLVMVPRGIGTMISMLIVGRLSNKMDPRLNMASGLFIMAVSMYFMSGFDTEIGTWPIVWTGIIQGFGMGQVMVPLLTMVFSTLPTRLRTEGTGVYNLIRNVGGSVGISIAFTLLSRSIQTNHEVLGGHITPYNQALQLSPLTAHMNLGNTHDLAALNGLLTKQAAMIGYNNDFKLMMILSLAAIPLVFLMKQPRYDKTVGSGRPQQHLATE